MAGRPNRINIDLGRYKQRWLDYCRANGVTPSAAFRQVVAKLVATEAGAAAPADSAARRSRKIRRELRLTPDEAALVENRASQAGMSETLWLTALVRAQISMQPQLGQAELVALGQSNLALLGIGRNLNQIARMLNAGRPPAPSALIEVLAALRVQCTAHVDQVALVLSSNLARWSRP